MTPQIMPGDDVTTSAGILSTAVINTAVMAVSRRYITALFSQIQPLKTLSNEPKQAPKLLRKTLNHLCEFQQE